MTEVFRKKEIIKLGKAFNFRGDKAWEIIRNGGRIIVDENYLFLKVDDYNKTFSISSIDDNFGYAMITILSVVNGNGEKYNYHFYEKCGDAHSRLKIGISNAMKMCEFSTGETPDAEIVLKAMINY